jgi:hypothetical protein
MIKLNAFPCHNGPLKPQKLEISLRQGIYDYDIQIQRTYKLIQSELSESIQQLIEKYDKVMISESLEKALRHKTTR